MQSNLNILVTFILEYLYCICYFILEYLCCICYKFVSIFCFKLFHVLCMSVDCIVADDNPSFHFISIKNLNLSSTSRHFLWLLVKCSLNIKDPRTWLHVWNQICTNHAVNVCKVLQFNLCSQWINSAFSELFFYL